MLYGPELAPSPEALLLALGLSAALVAVVYVLWSDRIAWEAATEQQCEAEEHA